MLDVLFVYTTVNYEKIMQLSRQKLNYKQLS